MNFTVGGSLVGGALIAAAVGLAWGLPRRPELWRKLPRNQWLGAVLAIVCLYWAGLMLAPMLEDELAGLRSLVWPVLIVFGVASVLLLDYVFTRALGGTLLLLANWVLQRSFVDHAPARGAVSLVAYALGLGALVMIAWPYRFRDWLALATQAARTRQLSALALLLAGLITLITALATH